MAKNIDKSIRVRMAPSPTGQIHIGNVRTVLFNWLFARKQGGAFILRVEDTDKARSKKEYEGTIFEDLTWLGIDWDEGPDKGGPFGPYRQSERTEIYKKYLRELLEKREAYYCYCTKEDLEAQKQELASQGLPPKYNGHCRNLKELPVGKKPEVIRFKVPEVKVGFDDIVRGKIVFDAALFGDIVIAKDLDSPLYNFAVVVDDALMKITHVIRGEEHLSNTPKQILMQQALGFSRPEYAHLPLILNPDRSKMSKRYADTALRSYRTEGYLAEAIVNFLAFLGWHPKDDSDVLSRDELVAQFDLSRVQKAGAVFNQEKLNWLNREYLKKMSDAEIAASTLPLFKEENIAADGEKVEKIVSVVRGRASTLRDFVSMGTLFFQLPEYETSLLVWQKAPSSLLQIAGILRDTVSGALQSVPPEKFTREHLTNIISGAIDGYQRGEVLWPLRVALSGRASSPDPIEIMGVIGKEESLRRIAVAVSKCEMQ